ncbi:MAG TPA: response regulator [Chitinophagaceae bacterium]|nr:response regulator [Chitinophagaceae bacterium]
MDKELNRLEEVSTRILQPGDLLKLSLGRIMIVDNSADLLETKEYILNRNRYTVKTLTNGYDIKKEIIEFQPQLLLLDIFLADEDGRNICEELKKDETTKHVSILVFSSSHEPLKNFESYYADGFIDKPFDLKKLLKKITSLLDPVKEPRLD